MNKAQTQSGAVQWGRMVSRVGTAAHRLVLKKRVLIPVLGLMLVFMVQIDLQSALLPGAQRERVSHYIEVFDPRRSPRSERERLVDSIMRESARLRIPPHMKIDGRRVQPAFLLTAYVRVESSFYRRARSVSDARGYMQLKLSTAQWINNRRALQPQSTVRPLRGELDLYDTHTNVALGVDYLNYLMTEMHDPRKVALAYNAGPNSVKAGRYIEDYWDKVLETYRQLQSGEFEELRR